MIPAHAALQLEQLERLLCRETGHRAIIDTRGAPVTEFPVCLRCGKFWRLEPGAPFDEQLPPLRGAVDA